MGNRNLPGDPSASPARRGYTLRLYDFLYANPGKYIDDEPIQFNAVTDSRITFTQADLDWFAEQSGDWNPIHVDPVAARRLLAGTTIVHGMYILLWSLECFCSWNRRLQKKISARFHCPVGCGESIDLYHELDSDAEHVLLVYSREQVVATIRLEGEDSNLIPILPEYGTPLRCEPVALEFAQLSDSIRAETLMCKPEDIGGKFPTLTSIIGLLPVTGIMTTSRVIGMQCPGLSSLYSGAEFELLGFEAEFSNTLEYRIIRQTVPQAPIRIEMKGGGILGYADAFFRPKPVLQPSLAEISSRIKPARAYDQVAWIIGGSRGLGETVSKLLAVSGARLVITYHKGQQDADLVASEIASHGGRCEIFQLDVNQSDQVKRFVDSCYSPTQVYFFASPKINRPRKLLFDRELYLSFIEVYVNSFARLIIQIKKRDSKNPLRVFWPSTVFIDESPKDFPEYTISKIAGEALCNHLAKEVPNLEIIVRRLPRIPSDQTSGIVNVSVFDPIEHLYSVVLEMGR